MYGGLTSTMIFLVCAYGYALHSRTRYDAIDIMLQRDALHVEAELAGARTSAEREHTLEASLLLGASARVYDSRAVAMQGASPDRTGAPAIDPRAALSDGTRHAYPAIAALAPAVYSVSPGAGAFALVRDDRGARWRAYVVPIASGDQYLVASLTLEPFDAAVATFGHLMLLGAVMASVATFFVGWLLARHALRPVATLATEAIAQSRAISGRVGSVTAHDELARLARTFHELLGTQEDALEAQQRFVAAASHELRAPLTVVLANLELLQRMAGHMPEDEHRQAVTEAYSEATRMARLVADLLSLARADAGAPLRREPVELDRVLTDVIGELRHQLTGQRLSVGAFEPVIVRGDSDRLKQLVLILIENAIRYTAADGSVAVSLRRLDGAAMIVVLDTGVGIGAADLQRVFERFYRADAARSRNVGGAGLGLSIARWIAEEHGGTVSLASHLGRGTTATVRLPEG